MCQVSSHIPRFKLTPLQGPQTKLYIKKNLITKASGMGKAGL